MNPKSKTIKSQETKILKVKSNKIPHLVALANKQVKLGSRENMELIQNKRGNNTSVNKLRPSPALASMSCSKQCKTTLFNLLWFLWKTAQLAASTRLTIC
jgi:hypothetical protein